MHTKPLLLLLPLLAFWLIACQAREPTLTDEERAQMVQEIIAISDASLDRCQTLVPEACLGQFDENATIRSEGRVFDMAQFSKAYAGHSSRFQSFHWIDRRYDVDVPAPGIVMTRRTGRFFVVFLNGAHGDTVDFVTTTQWEKIGSEWKITYVDETFR